MLVGCTSEQKVFTCVDATCRSHCPAPLEERPEQHAEIHWRQASIHQGAGKQRLLLQLVLQASSASPCDCATVIVRLCECDSEQKVFDSCECTCRSHCPSLLKEWPATCWQQTWIRTQVCSGWGYRLSSASPCNCRQVTQSAPTLSICFACPVLLQL
jgi:hypothetical protein